MVFLKWDNKNSRVSRESATGELCEDHGQLKDEMKTFWRKEVGGNYGVQLLAENSDFSDTS